MTIEEYMKDMKKKEEASPKRMKVEDVPRGMGWGNQSFAAAKISKIREKDPETISDFGRYMAEKRRKLHLQFNEDSSNKLLSGATAAVAALHSKEGQVVVAQNPIKSSLFRGISIWVDGFTVPSHQELRHLMLQYGGIFENYFRRDLVTHVICSTLTDTKIKDPRSLSRGLPIVKPEWIVDSITAGRILPWGSYQLQRISLEHPNQRTLESSFSTAKLDSGPLPLDWRDSSSTLTEAINRETEVPLELLAVENASSEKPEPSYSQADHGDRKSRLVQEHDRSVDDPTHKEELSAPRPTDQLQKDEWEIPKELEDILRLEEHQVHGEEVSLGVAERLKRKVSSGYSDAIKSHSTLGDKNFVQNYFKSSRLHFIGTWRNRYQSRYGSSGKHDKTDGQEHQGFNSVSEGDAAIIHIDMDCFFVAVVIRDRPELDGKPVAVCHSDSTRGTGEISSANYPARAFGIRAGTFVRDAKAKCPDLEIVPYNFEAYEQVADKVYDILHHHCGRVQAVSCDEAFLDVTGQGDACEIATTIRREIFGATRCTASAGVSRNMLLARLATRKAKPNGQQYIAPSQVDDFLAELAVEDLPGVGWTLKEKLHSHNLRKCFDVQRVSKEYLQREFGTKTGDMLWSYARGIDLREVQPAQERKSIGAEVNWGVRFLVLEDAQRFLVTLSTEVATRLQAATAKGRTITLKVKRRKEGTGEPYKFMGCGVCDNFSRSETVAYATDSQEVLLRVAKQLFNSFAFDVRDVRGVGLQVTRLEAVGPGQSLKGGQGQQRAIKSWLAPEISKATLKEVVLPVRKSGDGTNMKSSVALKTELVEPVNVRKTISEDPELPSTEPAFKQTGSLSLQPQPGPRAPTSPEPKKITTSKDHSGTDGKGPLRIGKSLKKPSRTPTTNLPAISELDLSVLASLPPEILAEIQEVYGEVPFHPRAASKPLEKPSSPVSLTEREDASTVSQPGGKMEASMEKNGPNGCRVASPSETRRERGESSKLPVVNPDIMALPPASQLDPSVMAALPLSLRRELEREYKRQQVQKSDRITVPKIIKDKELKTPRRAGNEVQELNDRETSTSLGELWFGSPPKWIELFKTYKGEEYSALCVVAEHMSCSLTCKPFSAVMLSLLPQLSGSLSFPPSNEKVIQSWVELLKQYAQHMVACDLEEICMTMRMLRRVAAKSQAWRIVEDLIISFVQALVGECYGGHLKI